MKVFEKLTTGETGHVDDMESWVRKAVEKLPTKYDIVIKYNLQTGLRPSEALHSIRLLHNEPDKYISKKHDGSLIEHMKYPSLMRRTKTYVSIITPAMQDQAKSYDGYKTCQAMI